ncbi:glucose 1-dehydrogenase [Bradyrhizobium sp. Rc2d]|uniref:SDR family oxidoreductase n=1 Tax=Bradyrhizobium sp. Rc2d TaxID=1855321 RepID=UPI00088E2ED9|nr:SDR family NAD(P)-dependent oxidoreductase [Bradyrhizobium sp. Rc2d]SDJ53722.1 glucose 1-dehydrogenase [Bradyrhizobium sp. Rc2d]
MSGQDVALVTGAARGIGLGIARRLLDTGYNVALLDLDASALDVALEELRRAHSAERVVAAQANITRPGDIAQALKEVTEKFGHVDVLVNNAGIVRDRRFMKLEEADWDAVIDTNLKSQFLTCQAIIPGMIERGYGRIVNISSRAWLGGFGQANYSAAKGGVVSLTRSLAIEFAAQGITVNAVAPGIVDTPMFRGFKPEVQERLQESVPVQRIGTADDVAEAVLFFASRQSAYITGQLLYVCGGRSLSSPSV